MSKNYVNIVDRNHLLEIIKKFDRRDSDIKGRIAHILKALWNCERLNKTIDTDIDFELLKRSFPQFKEVIKYVQKQIITAKKLNRPFYMSPILLIGDPGLAKTYFVYQLSELLKLPYFEISLATLTASFALSGGNMQWGEGRPGFIIESIAKSEVANPLFLIDEIDKASGSGRYDPMAPFYSLLEPHSASRFRDEALELEVNASHVIWIATANEELKIHAPILSRLKRFDIKQPTPAEMFGVIDSIYLSLRVKGGLEQLISPDLAQSIKEQLSTLSPRLVRIALEETITTALFNDRSELHLDDLPNIQAGGHRVGFY